MRKKSKLSASFVRSFRSSLYFFYVWPEIYNTDSKSNLSFIYIYLYINFLLRVLLALRMSIPVAKNRSVLLMYGSENQRKAIRPIKDFLESSSRPFLELTFKRKLSTRNTSGPEKKFIFGFDLIGEYIEKSNQVINILYLEALKGRSIGRAKYGAAVNFVVSAVYFKYLFQEGSITHVVVSNDHNPENRVLCHIARCFGVETIYQQHSTTSRDFPPLDFNYALLSGYHAKTTYERIACDRRNKLIFKRSCAAPKIFIVGDYRSATGSDNALAVNRQSGRTLGIAVNAFDEASHLKTLIELIDENFDIINIRLHPALSQTQAREFVNLSSEFTSVTISIPSQQSLTEFIKTIDCLIAGDSNIHLDVNLKNVDSYYYQTPGSPVLEDTYGFVSSGLVGSIAVEETGVKFLSASRARPAALENYTASFATRQDLLADALLEIFS